MPENIDLKERTLLSDVGSRDELFQCRASPKFMSITISEARESRIVVETRI